LHPDLCAHPWGNYDRPSSLVAQFGKRKVAYDLYKKERRGEAERDTTLKNFVAEYKGKDMYLIDEVPIPMAEKM
jgi:hypothetical protein